MRSKTLFTLTLLITTFGSSASWAADKQEEAKDPANPAEVNCLVLPPLSSVECFTADYSFGAGATKECAYTYITYQKNGTFIEKQIVRRGQINRPSDPVILLTFPIATVINGIVSKGVAKNRALKMIDNVIRRLKLEYPECKH